MDPGTKVEVRSRFEQFQADGQFGTAIEVAKRPPEKYVRKLTAPPPPRKEKGQGDGFNFGGGLP